MTPLWFTLPLLCYKRGLYSCKAWRRWGKRESWWKCSALNPNISISITPLRLMISQQQQQGCFSTLNWSFHQSHHPMFLFLCGQHHRACRRTTTTTTTVVLIVQWRVPQFPRTCAPHNPCRLHGRTSMILTLALTLVLILLFTCSTCSTCIF